MYQEIGHQKKEEREKKKAYCTLMVLTFSVSGGPGRARFVVAGKTWSQNRVIGYVTSHSEYVYSTRKPVQLMLIPDEVDTPSESKSRLQPEKVMKISTFWPSLVDSKVRTSTRQVPKKQKDETSTKEETSSATTKTTTIRASRKPRQTARQVKATKPKQTKLQKPTPTEKKKQTKQTRQTRQTKRTKQATLNHKA